MNLTEDQKQYLALRSVTREEIWTAINHLGAWKSLGPDDGLNVGFYKVHALELSWQRYL